MKRWVLFLILCLLLVVAYFAFNSSKVSSTSQIIPIHQISPTPAAVFTKVIRVYDGDTIEIEGGQKVRYIGMDTAEVYPKRQCFSDEALNKNKELVLGKTVKLEKDVSETDKYGRLLRYVYIPSASSGLEIFVNDELVKEGYAKIETVPPDVSYKNRFLESEKYARENNLGFWGKCFK